MKKVFFISAILALTVFASCKNESKEQEAAAPKEDVKQNFSVDLDVISNLEDNFALYYTEDGTINFTSDKAVWSGVKGQPTTQTVTLNLSEEILPTDIRLDFGINKEQGDIVLEKFKLNYYGKSFQARGSEFFKYFIPNDSVKTEINEVRGTVKFLKNPKGHFTPFFYPNVTILDEIKKITK
jgi:hypothetical protein